MSCEGTIADTHSVYRKCHQHHWDFENDCALYGAFEFDPDDDKISVYWSELIEPHEVLSLHDSESGKASDKNGVLSLVAADIRRGNMLALDHTPHDPEAKHNSHSSISKLLPGYNRVRAYDQLVDSCDPVLPVPRLKGVPER